MTPEEETIRLDQFLKAQSLVETGGMAKILIQEGQVFVNGEIETRRRRQLRSGDVVQFEDQIFPVEFDS